MRPSWRIPTWIRGAFLLLNFELGESLLAFRAGVQ